jgi:hypothetical protein
MANHGWRCGVREHQGCAIRGNVQPGTVLACFGNRIGQWPEQSMAIVPAISDQSTSIWPTSITCFQRASSCA